MEIAFFLFNFDVQILHFLIKNNNNFLYILINWQSRIFATNLTLLMNSPVWKRATLLFRTFWKITRPFINKKEECTEIKLGYNKTGEISTLWKNVDLLSHLSPWLEKPQSPSHAWHLWNQPNTWGLNSWLLPLFVSPLFSSFCWLITDSSFSSSIDGIEW